MLRYYQNRYMRLGNKAVNSDAEVPTQTRHEALFSLEKCQFPLCPDEGGTQEHTGLKYRSQDNLVQPEELHQVYRPADNAASKGTLATLDLPWGRKRGRG